ncbi:MAG: hypothetical protein ACJ8AT_18530 [Hyalangium sp.]|uniref:SitA5 family polymorphic toxin n=1 Tax=Hyalangium sp. TaxID=2028555 RepID=UPI00389AFE71
MRWKQAGALLMAVLTGCASTPRALYSQVDPYEAELAAMRYELHVLTANSGQSEPVEVSREDFQRAMRTIARTVRTAEPPMETGRLLMEGGLQAGLLAEVEHGRVVRLMPLEESSPLDAGSAAELKREYLKLCQREYNGGDCLGLLTDGPTLTREDLRTLGLALAFKGVLKETGVALKGMVSPQALVAMIAWTCCFYLLLWLLPEPTSKLLAAGLTVALLAWLPVHTLWSLMDEWGQLVHDVDRATRYEQIEQASEKFRRAIGENTARVVLMLVTAALSGVGQLAEKLPMLPGFEQAAEWAEAQGLSLGQVGEVEAVAADEEDTFTLMVRRPGGGAAAEAVEEQEGATLIIRHQGGSRQVAFNGQRWHVPANRSVRDIPPRDPVGDTLQEAAPRVARQWSRSELTDAQTAAIAEALKKGEYMRANLMERMFRGQWVESVLRDEFPALRWSKTGVDAVDPSTGLKYEVLSGTISNMELHGRRMAEEFFRLITF